MEKTKFERVRRNKFYLISPGLLGKTGDIVADNPSKPKFIYGKITRKENLKDLTNSEKEKFLIMIKKNIFILGEPCWFSNWMVAL